MPDTRANRDALRRSFLTESAELRFSSPLFSKLALACAEDEEMIELGSAVRPGQSIGHLLPMAAQFLLLRAADTELSLYFPSLTDSPLPASQAFPVFKKFCLARRDELTSLLATRTVNSNLVERTSILLPVLAYVSRLAHQPITLIEICCSAGLNLLFDRYYYDFGSAGRVGSDLSPVHLSCKVIGSSSPPVSQIPAIEARVGIDLVKIDSSDPVERLWMEAVLFPEWKSEREHLKAALEFRARHPLRIIEGDAVVQLPAVLAEFSGPLCVLHTYCMSQWSDSAKSALDEILREASRHRDIHRIGIDARTPEPPEWVRDRMRKLAAARIPLHKRSLPSAIDHTWYAKQDSSTRVLGQADGFGAWIDWHAPIAS